MQKQKRTKFKTENVLLLLEFKTFTCQYVRNNYIVIEVADVRYLQHSTTYFDHLFPSVLTTLLCVCFFPPTSVNKSEVYGFRLSSCVLLAYLLTGTSAQT